MVLSQLDIWLLMVQEEMISFYFFQISDNTNDLQQLKRHTANAVKVKNLNLFFINSHICCLPWSFVINSKNQLCLTNIGKEFMGEYWEIQGMDLKAGNQAQKILREPEYSRDPAPSLQATCVLPQYETRVSWALSPTPINS